MLRQLRDPLALKLCKGFWQVLFVGEIHELPWHVPLFQLLVGLADVSQLVHFDWKMPKPQVHESHECPKLAQQQTQHSPPLLSSDTKRTASQ